jgi:hypothetical protein
VLVFSSVRCITLARENGVVGNETGLYLSKIAFASCWKRVEAKSPTSISFPSDESPAECRSTVALNGLLGIYVCYCGAG